MRVAIDGPAGSGKSTVARRIADKTGFFFLNSGNFYRAITLAVFRAGRDLESESAVIETAENSTVDITNGRIRLNGEDVEDELHTDAVDEYVAEHSAIVRVREIVNEHIRRATADMDVVAEGRDMTTVVFPHAEVKFFLDASMDTRVGRRYAQGISGLSEEEIRKNLEKRDEIDKNKPFGALKIGEDAEYLDTTALTIDSVCEKVLDTINSKKRKTQENDNNMVESGQDHANNNETTQETTQSMLQEEYLKSLEQIEEGQVIEGQVIQIGSEQVFIDIGYKSEGKIPVSEFKETPEIGDTVHVVLVRKEGKEGQVVVSKEQADIKLLWHELRAAKDNDEAVEGTFDKAIKGGYEVDLGYNIRGFCPLSKSDIRRVEDQDALVGMKSKFLIERLTSSNKIKIILSRRDWLEREREEKKREFFEEVSIGEEVTGTVKSFTSFGAFIDLGGFDGLLHINDMSWGHVTRPKDYIKKGQEVTLKVIRMDPEEEKINLSLKHFTPDPWSTFEEKYSEGDVVHGKVTKLTDFGAFIELEEGIEGLAHISELSWIRRINHPKEVLSIGDEVDVKILGYDLQKGRVSLGLKQVLPNPWDSVETQYPVGMQLRRKVVKITNAGAFVELEEGIDGFIHVDDLSWTKKYKHPSAVLSEGEEYDFVVIGVDPESQRIRLGMKQLTDDPWQDLASIYKRGSIIEGEVSSITDFGIFLRVQGGIEGLIHRSNIPENRDEPNEDPLSRFSEGDKVQASVLEVNPEKKKLSLSIKEYQRKVQREELSKYIHDEEAEHTATFADILKQKGEAPLDSQEDE